MTNPYAPTDRRLSERRIPLAVAQFAVQENARLAQDAARHRFARTIFAIEDVERAASEMQVGDTTEVENEKYDAAIDEAMKATAPRVSAQQELK